MIKVKQRYLYFTLKYRMSTVLTISILWTFDIINQVDIIYIQLPVRACESTRTGGLKKLVGAKLVERVGSSH